MVVSPDGRGGKKEAEKTPEGRILRECSSSEEKREGRSELSIWGMEKSVPPRWTGEKLKKRGEEGGEVFVPRGKDVTSVRP